jgi:SM-20-related protein
MAAIPHIILDNFLPDEEHRGLLAHVLAVADFAPGSVDTKNGFEYRPDLRKGYLSNDRLGPNLRSFRSALRQAFGDICPKLGMARFNLAAIEIRLAAHTHGDFFSAHRDTMTGRSREMSERDRIITAVYYLHRQPKPFQGGELRIYPFDDSAPLTVEPRDNRLIAFPAFMLHEVTEVTVPSGEFADSRFSVSCWFDRERPTNKP